MRRARLFQNRLAPSWLAGLTLIAAPVWALSPGEEALQANPIDSRGSTAAPVTSEPTANGAAEGQPDAITRPDEPAVEQMDPAEHGAGEPAGTEPVARESKADTPISSEPVVRESEPEDAVENLPAADEADTTESVVVGPVDGDSAQLEPDDVAPAMQAELIVEQRNFDRLFEAGRFDSAVESGKRLVGMAIEVNGLGSLAAGNALTSLALAQREAGDLPAAAENFQAAVAAIEASKDRLAKELIVPLRGLGRTHLEARRPDAAAEDYERALHVSQVNDGPQNLEQIALLNELSEAYFQLGDFKQADALQRYTVGLYKRRFSADDDKRMLPALYQRAHWLVRMNQPIGAQVVYGQIVRIVEKSDGRDSLELLPALIGGAHTFIYSAESDSKQQGERRLRRAISIVKKSETATLENHGDAEIALGDFYNLIGERTSARRAYRRAWDVLDTGELENMAALDERFGEPKPLSRQDVVEDPGPVGTVADFADTYDDGTNLGYVSVVFDVNARGRVENQRIIESEPPRFRDAEALRWVRRFVYRPKMADKEPVAARDRQFRYNFRYRDVDLAEFERVAVADDDSGDEPDGEEDPDGEEEGND